MKIIMIRNENEILKYTGNGSNEEKAMKVVMK
jgi:hypothetical protein